MSPRSECHPGELLSYLRVLADGSQRNQFFDLRYSPPAGVMRRRFVSVLRLHQIASRITDLSPDADVYVGVALRERARGDKTAVTGSRLLYIESDDPGTRERLAGFACSPSMVVASGSPGHLHIYWQLRERASAAEIQSTNRRLALGLHGEPGCADITRLLRPPTSLNHKHTPPAPVKLIGHDPEARYALADLLAALPHDPQPGCALPARPTGSGRAGRTAIDRELLTIPAADYVRVLAGREPNRAGKVLCPFHEETDPSLQLYPDGTFYCFGARCKRGGSIFDFAAALWATGTRQQDFLNLRRRLAATFAITPRPNGGPGCP
ncbi:MAG: CHC2 zinc finger domain-containing protein [Solirubrobacteraceae bacterium]